MEGGVEPPAGSTLEFVHTDIIRLRLYSWPVDVSNTTVTFQPASLALRLVPQHTGLQLRVRCWCRDREPQHTLTLLRWDLLGPFLFIIVERIAPAAETGNTPCRPLPTISERVKSVVMLCGDGNYTSSGHVVGMLDRDLRTAKLRCRDNSGGVDLSVLLIREENLSNHERRQPQHQKRCESFGRHRCRHRRRKSSALARSRKNCYLWNTLRSKSLPLLLLSPVYIADR